MSQPSENNETTTAQVRKKGTSKAKQTPSAKPATPEHLRKLLDKFAK